jgi:hypothetical protein
MTLAEMYRSERDPDVDSWTAGRYAGSVAPKELRWELRGTFTEGSVHTDRYLLYHSTYLEMPLLHFHDDSSHIRGAILWFSLDGKATPKDWGEILKLIGNGYEVFSFDFRGSGETRMNYRVDSDSTANATADDFDEAYVNPLGSVLADSVYNSLLTGRPYFLEMMDDIKIAELFVHNLDPKSPRRHVILDGVGPAITLAVRYKEIDPQVAILAPESPPIVNWSTLVAVGQEQWPIAFLMPSGTALTAEKRLSDSPR